MTNWEEKLCQLCCGVAGLYHRREHLVLQGEMDRAEDIDPHIEMSIGHLREWLLKNEKGDLDE